jgi:hypothetical protein
VENGRSLLWKGRIAKHLSIHSSEEAEINLMNGLELFKDLEIKPGMAIGHLFVGEHYAAPSEVEPALIHLRKAEESFASMDMYYWLNMAQTLVRHLAPVQ